MLDGFEWDEAKNQSNIAKHSVSFEQAARIFDGPIITALDDLGQYGEVREISVGMLEGAVVLVVVHTDRSGVMRIISARRALRREARRYYDEIKKANER